MTNSIAIGLVLLIVVAVTADQMAFGGAATLWTGRAFLDLVAWIAFWR